MTVFTDEEEDFFSSTARTFDEDPEDIRLTLDHLTQLDLMSSRNVFSLLRTKGLSKKEAFNLVATSAKESWRKNKNLLEILKNKTEITTHITPEEIDKCGSSATINAKTQAKDIENGILNHPLCSNPRNINSIEEAELNQFDVVFIPGGHGPMVDLYNNEKVGEIITHINSKNGTVGALCHGPAALMSTTAKNGDGSWLFEGYKMTVFTDEEELQTRPGKLGIPWYLEGIRLTLDHLTQLDLMSSRNVFSLLRTKGLSKKEAFNLVATSAKESWRKNKNLLEILKNKTEITTHITPEEIDKCGSSATINAKTQAKDIENGILNHPLCSNPRNINSIEEAELNQFDVVFIPGGHGPMVDLYNNEKVGEIITHINSKNGTVGALCHGPAALMSTTAKNGDGSWLFEGYKMTVFTDEEELQTRPGKLGIPWYLEGIRLTLDHLTQLDLMSSRNVFSLLRTKGLSKKEAFNLVATSAKESWRKNKNLLEILKNKTEITTHITPEEIDKCGSSATINAKTQAKDIENGILNHPLCSNPRNINSIEEAELNQFDVVFIPGGHGPMVDLYNNEKVGEIITHINSKNGTVGALCHGPAALMSTTAKNGDGSWLFEGYKMTVFTDEEELQTRPGKLGIPWYLEGIRLTLDHLTQLDLMSSRNVFSLLRTKGLSKKEAFNLVATSAKESWRKNKNLLEILKNKTEITTHITPEEIDKCGSSATINAKTQAKDIENGILNHPLCSNPRNINSIEEAELNQFDVVFIPGGHGPMVDLYNNEKVGEIITHINSKNGTVGALCHGPAALMSTTAKNGDGSWLFEGYKMTVFTDEEELQTRPGKLGIPWYLEGSLRNLGGVLDTATAPWTSHVVVDRNLITGQNPASAEATADAIIDRLSMQGVVELSSLKESA
jgi:putative intracellular protease/amidase/ribosomal protein S3